MIRAALAITLLAALLAAGGCSSHSLKGSPLWDDDYRPDDNVEVAPAEDRINVWPLFYYRDPAFSILWPFITVTDEGHSAYPIYEYLREDDRLGIGVLHPWIPAFSEVRSEDGFWRVAHVAHDREDGMTTALPLFHRNREFFWSLPYSTNLGDTEDFRGVLGPLFFVRESGKSRMAYFPFPLAGTWWDDSAGAQALPLFYYNRPDGTDDPAYIANVGGLLFHRNYRKADRHHGFALFPLIHFGRNGSTRWHGTLPLWHWKTDGRDAGHFYSALYAETHSGDDHTRVVPPLLGIDRKQGDRRWTSLPYPLVHRIRRGDDGGLTVFPLFSSYRRADGTGRFLSLPYSRETGKWSNVLGPVYHHATRENGWSTTALWPLFRSTRDGDDRSSYLFPLWYARSTANSRTIVSPFYARSTANDADFRAIPLLLSGQVRSGEGRYTSVLFPFFHHYRDEDTRVGGLFPLGIAAKSEDTRAFFSPLATYFHEKDEDRFYNLGTILAGHYRDGTYWNAWVLASILGASGDPGRGFEAHAFPLAYYSSMPDDRVRWRSLLGLLAWADRDTRNRDEIVAGWRAQLESNPPAATATRTVRLDTQRYALSLFGVNNRLRMTAAPSPEAGGGVEITSTRTASSWLFPLWYRRTIEDGRHRACVLGRLYDEVSDTDASGDRYHRQRVLWRVYHRERLGDRTAIDAFPFLAFDRAPGMRRASFAGGLAEYRVRDGDRRIRLLWIPIPL